MIPGLCPHQALCHRAASWYIGGRDSGSVDSTPRCLPAALCNSCHCCETHSIPPAVQVSTGTWQC
eukprot:3903953-Amphidinium_carterae.1